MFSSSPMFIPAAALTAGIIAGILGIGIIGGAVMILTAVGFYLIILRSKRKPTEYLKKSKYHIIWVVSLFSGIGIIDADFNRPFQITDSELALWDYARGEIHELDVKSRGDRLRVKIDSLYSKQGETRKCRNLDIILITTPSNLMVGDIIKFPVGLSAIEDNLNYKESGYKKAMNRKGIYYNAQSDAIDIHIIGNSCSSHSFSMRMRDNVIEAIEKSGLQRNTINFLVPVITGDDSFLNQETRELFSKAGVAHALALSGLHVGIIISILMVVLFPLNVVGRYKVRMLLTVILIWVFTFMSGASASTIRAAVMASFLFASLLLERKNSAFNSLCGAAFVILLINPYSLLDVGFQMSFASVGILIAFGNSLNLVSHHSHPKVFKLVAMFLATLTVSLGIWVLSAYYFKVVPISVIPSNIVLLPLLPLYISLAIIHVIGNMVGINLEIIRYVLDNSYYLYTNFLDWLISNGATYSNVKVNEGVIIIWCIGLVFLAIFLHLGRRKWMSVVSAVCICGSLGYTVYLNFREEGEGFIIQQRYDKMGMMIYNEYGEKMIEPSVNAISMINAANKKIVFVDTSVDGVKSVKCDYVVLSRGFKGDIDSVLNKFSPDVLVIHPSVFRKKESSLKIIADEWGIKCYSLREDGPLRILE